jgi:hypothetical protein
VVLVVTDLRGDFTHYRPQLSPRSRLKLFQFRPQIREAIFMLSNLTDQFLNL